MLKHDDISTRHRSGMPHNYLSFTQISVLPPLRRFPPNLVTCNRRPMLSA